MLGYWGGGGSDSNPELSGSKIWGRTAGSWLTPEHGKLISQPALQHSLWVSMSVSKPLCISSGLDVVDAKKNPWKSSKLLEGWIYSLPMALGVAVLVGAVKIISQQRRFTIRAIQMIDSSVTSQMEKSG